MTLKTIIQALAAAKGAEAEKGKKEQRQEAAGKVASVGSRFAPAKAPTLVVNNR
jgi:hypothetical protein